MRQLPCRLDIAFTDMSCIHAGSGSRCPRSAMIDVVGRDGSHVVRRVTCALVGCVALLPAAAWATGGRAAAPRCPLPVPVPGHAATVGLHPRPDVAYVVSPGRKASKTDNGGMMTLIVHAPGTCRFLLGPDVWIDVVRGSAKVKPAHSRDVHGCSGIRRVADYALKAHQYIIQIDASPRPKQAVMVVRPL